jgi:hypothetical protein
MPALGGGNANILSVIRLTVGAARRLFRRIYRRRAIIDHSEVDSPLLARVSLPPEIWSTIAFFACTDGGKTASSLLRVSKPIRHGAMAHAYDIVVLSGRRSTKSFSKLLGRKPAIRPYIQFLFLSEVDPPGTPPVTSDLKVANNHPPTDHFTLNDNSLKYPPIRVHFHIIRLLEVVSPTLKVLAFIALNVGRFRIGVISILNQVSMPALRSLTLHGTISEYGHLCSVPSLTHLHISAHHMRFINYMNLIAASSDGSPSLSHLTMSGISQVSRVREMLEQFLVDRPEGHYTQWPYPRCARLPSWTRSVTLVTEPVTDRPLDEHNDGVPESLVQFWTSLKVQVKNDREFKIAPMPQALKSDSLHGWRAYWLHKVVQGEL